MNLDITYWGPLHRELRWGLWEKYAMGPHLMLTVASQTRHDVRRKMAAPQTRHASPEREQSWFIAPQAVQGEIRREI